MNGPLRKTDAMGLPPKRMGSTSDPGFNDLCTISGRILKTYPCTTTMDKGMVGGPFS